MNEQIHSQQQFQHTPTLLWQRHVSIPFSYALSKNQMFARTRSGNVMLRRESRDLRLQITRAVKAALYEQHVAHNKLWISILVDKPDHRGDAVNVIDLICDALKDAMRVDDRWFCIGNVDWQVNKTNPRIHIFFGQDTDEDAQVCSICGLIKPLTAFHKSKRYTLGVTYECKSCRKTLRTSKH